MSNQNSSFINLGSVTNAHKAQKLLEENNILSRVGKVPSQFNGCSFGLYVKNEKKDEITLLLRASSFKIL